MGKDGWAYKHGGSCRRAGGLTLTKLQPQFGLSAKHEDHGLIKLE